MTARPALLPQLHRMDRRWAALALAALLLCRVASSQRDLDTVNILVRAGRAVCVEG